MTSEEWALAVTCFCSGLASGLLGMLCMIMRPMLSAMDGTDFQRFMRAFLRYADNGLGKVFNYVWAVGMFFGPMVALVLLWNDRGSISFILTSIGLGIVTFGVIVVSNVWKTPHYKVMLAWDPDSLPANWEGGRQRYLNINWFQMATTWASFTIFLAALASQ